MTTTLLRIEHLHVAHEGQPPIVSGWNAALGPGVVLVHGDTGSGKSSLLRVLSGDAQAAGELTVAGVAAASQRQAYRQQVFHVDSWTDRYDQMTPMECARALSHGQGIDGPMWDELVESFALGAHLEKSLFMLSTGSKRKVWLAAALVSSLPLVLLDEPSAALDAASVKALWSALAREAAAPTRLVVVASSDVPSGVPFARRFDLPLAG